MIARRWYILPVVAIGVGAVAMALALPRRHGAVVEQPEPAATIAMAPARPQAAIAPAVPASAVLPPKPPLATEWEPPGPDATAQEVRAWLDTQDARLAAGEQRLTLDDPVIETFARIPTAHWHELLASLERCTGNWKATAVTRHALVRAAQPEHREPVLAAFARYPFLVEAISRCGWIAEAAPTMRALLTEKGAAQCGYGDTARIIAALASLRDAQDHALFADALARMKYGYWQAAIARSLATIPDFDLEAAVRGAWRHFGRAQYMDLQDGFAVAAARAGIAEALPVAMLHALGGRETKWSSELLQEEARVFLWEHFALKVDLDDPAATSAWWETARDRVRWDAQAHRWHGPPPPPAKPVARPPPVGAGTNEF